MIVAFGDFELDGGLYQLRRGGEVVRLEPKVFDVLAYLVRQRERVVAKDELLEKLWPGEFVSESVLPRCITAARKALGDSSTGQTIIQTVHGRGYRFVAPVQVRTGAGEAGVETDATSPGRQASVFVGRARAMETLRGGLEDALAGRGRLLLLVGEPGIGKTRTADELAATAAQRGARVLTGRCYEGDGAPAFWPWVQILRAAIADRERPVLATELGPGAADVAQLVPELCERISGLAAPAPLAPEQARFRLFDAIATFLERASRTQPLVLVIDDLHWADKPSLLLLQFVAREMRAAHVLIVGAYRDVELKRQHPLAEALGELQREPLCERITLRGLDADDVARFIAATAGREAPPAMVSAVHEMTEGNPLFVGEIVRLLAAEGGLERASQGTAWRISLPQGVREAIGRRLNGLGEECNRVLTLASVIGREFGLRVLERIADVPGERLLELLAEAVDARILTETASVGRYAFSHALVRETLYEELATPVRVRLHRRVGEVLQDAYGASPEPHLAELAHHFFQAAPGGDVERAVDYAARAAERSVRLLAYEEAAGHYERALQALDIGASADEERRCALLLRLGDARSRAGERTVARATFERAAEIARALGRADQLARAALGFGGRAEMGMPRDDKLLALLEEGLRARRGHRGRAARPHPRAARRHHPLLGLAGDTRRAQPRGRRAGAPYG